MLGEALTRLEAALGELESGVTRHFDADLRRSDIETELAVMQDDRARLAQELDQATSRLGRVEGAHEHVGARVDAAILALRDALGDAGTARGAHEV